MFDSTQILKDAGAVSSSGYGTVDESAKVINLGNGLVRGNVIFDITAINIGDNDELYELHLMGGDDENFTNEVSLCSKEIGAKESLQGNLDSYISRIILGFQNEHAGTIYPYVRVRHVISGTSPSINYKARLEKDLPMLGHAFDAIDFMTTTTT